MRYLILVMVVFALLGCSTPNPIEQKIYPDLNLASTQNNSQGNNDQDLGQWLSWGYYKLEIARDGSYAEIVPLRNGAYETYGHHINALKFLESGPCSHCVWTSNVKLTIEGNVSVDVSIKHPFSNPCFTGFDVRGIIMFPASQRIYDDDLRSAAGLLPSDNDPRWVSSSIKGDAELVNREGWTQFWDPVDQCNGGYTESGYPIFDYWPGKFATGDHVGTINPFIRFHSTEIRHMFEAGKTVTMTYIIKPPAQGPIEACYAVYAHWAIPDVLPVTNPETDFPLDANSCLPYELEIYQDGIIDPDAPPEVSAEKIHIRMKHWGVIPIEDDGGENWDCTQTDYVDSALSADFELHPGGLPDEYWPTVFYPYGYTKLPDSFFPGTLPILYGIPINDPDPLNIGRVGTDYWIMDIQFGPRDGVW